MIETSLAENEQTRYDRQISLPEIGIAGQQRRDSNEGRNTSDNEPKEARHQRTKVPTSAETLPT